MTELTDEAREERISALLGKLNIEPNRTERYLLFYEARRLIMGRSARQIEKMEVEKGLR